MYSKSSNSRATVLHIRKAVNKHEVIFKGYTITSLVKSIKAEADITQHVNESFTLEHLLNLISDHDDDTLITSRSLLQCNNGVRTYIPPTGTIVVVELLNNNLKCTTTIRKFTKNEHVESSIVVNKTSASFGTLIIKIEKTDVANVIVSWTLLL